MPTPADERALVGALVDKDQILSLEAQLALDRGKGGDLRASGIWLDTKSVSLSRTAFQTIFAGSFFDAMARTTPLSFSWRRICWRSA